MIGRALLLHRARAGAVTPGRLPKKPEAELALAGQLCALQAAAVGVSQEELEEELLVLARAHPRAKLALGLVKLLLDRVEVQPPEPAVADRRAAWFRTAREVLHALPEGATPEGYEEALQAALPEGLARVRAELHADLPERRTIEAVEPLTPEELLQRWELGQVQGLLLFSTRLTLELPAPGKLELRRLLRWLRFCRLVADVEPLPRGLRLQIEGPGTIVELGKRYGLQLANFLPEVLALQDFTLTAQIRLPHREPLTLTVTPADGLQAPARPRGHLPEPIEGLAAALEGDGLSIDPAPPPRPVGRNALCLPDVAVSAGQRTIAIEVFHRWHRGALGTRLAQLQARPDPGLLLLCERAIAEQAGATGHPQVVLFRDVPPVKRLRTALLARLADGA